MPTPTTAQPRRALNLTPDEQRRRQDFEYSQAFSLAAPAGTAGQITIKTEADTYFVCQQMMAASTAQFWARIRDDGSGQIWQSDYVNNLSCFGTRERPNLFVTPIIVPPMSVITIDLINNSGVANAGEIVLGGYKLAGAEFNWDRTAKLDRWFQYVAAKAVGALAIDTIPIRLQADAHFEVHKMLARKITNAVVVTGDFSARISDSDTSKSWSDRSVRRDNQFGTAQYPAMLPWPKLLRPNIVVQVEVTDLSGVGNTIEIVLEGAKRYI